MNKKYLKYYICHSKKFEAFLMELHCMQGCIYEIIPRGEGGGGGELGPHNYKL